MPAHVSAHSRRVGCVRFMRESLRVVYRSSLQFTAPETAADIVDREHSRAGSFNQAPCPAQQPGRRRSRLLRADPVDTWQSSPRGECLALWQASAYGRVQKGTDTSPAPLLAYTLELGVFLTARAPTEGSCPPARAAESSSRLAGVPARTPRRAPSSDSRGAPGPRGAFSRRLS